MKPFMSYPIIGLAVFLTGCASTGSGGGSSAVSSNNTDSLTKKNEVYIGQFAVTFVTRDSGSAKSQSPMIRHNGSDYAKSNLVAKLSGVPESTFQAIADKAYQDFVADLEAKGFTVGNANDLKQVPEWGDLDPMDTPYQPSSVMPGFLNKGSQDKITYKAEPTYLFGVQTQAGQITPLPYQLADLSESVGKPVFAVNYTVHFAYFDSDTDYTIDYNDVAINGIERKTTTLSASVTLGQGIQVTSGSIAQFLVGPVGTFSDNGYVQLTDAVIVGGAYGENEDTTSGAQKAANAFSSALGMFSGRSSSTTEISINANPDYYEFGALKALDEANNRIVEQLTP